MIRGRGAQSWAVERGNARGDTCFLAALLAGVVLTGVALADVALAGVVALFGVVLADVALAEVALLDVAFACVLLACVPSAGLLFAGVTFALSIWIGLTLVTTSLDGGQDMGGGTSVATGPSGC